MHCPCPVCGYFVSIRRKRSNNASNRLFWVDVDESVLHHTPALCTSRGKPSVEYLTRNPNFRSLLATSTGDHGGQSKRKKAKEIQRDTRLDLALNPSLASIFTARRVVENVAWDEYVKSFHILPQWLQKYCLYNPRSRFAFVPQQELIPDATFRGLFFANGTILHLVEKCGVRMLRQDYTHISSRLFNGKAMIISGRLSDNSTIPVAVGIFAEWKTDNETNAPTQRQHDEIMRELEVHNPLATRYLRSVDPIHWALYAQCDSVNQVENAADDSMYTCVRIYNTRTSNSTDSEISRLKSNLAQSLHPLQFVQMVADMWMKKLGEMEFLPHIIKCNPNGGSWNNFFVSDAIAKEHAENSQASRNMFCRPCLPNSRIYQVVARNSNGVYKECHVNLKDRWRNKCYFFEQLKRPCAHALAAYRESVAHVNPPPDEYERVGSL
eukprot:764360-Hanusia_phi.AAC.2